MNLRYKILISLLMPLLSTTGKAAPEEFWCRPVKGQQPTAVEAYLSCGNPTNETEKSFLCRQKAECAYFGERKAALLVAASAKAAEVSRRKGYNVTDPNLYSGRTEAGIGFEATVNNLSNLGQFAEELKRKMHEAGPWLEAEVSCLGKMVGKDIQCPDVNSCKGAQVTSIRPAKVAVGFSREDILPLTKPAGRAD